MSGVSSTTGASHVVVTPLGGIQTGGAGAGAPLLPSPSVDPIATLYQLAAKANEAQGRQARNEARSTFAAKERAEKEIAAAMERARRAQEEQKGFFDSMGIGSLVGILSSQPLIVMADMGMHMARMTPDFLESFEKDNAAEIELAAKAFCAASNAALLTDGLCGNPRAYQALVALGGLVIQESGVFGEDASELAGSAMLASSGSGFAGRANAVAIVADKDSATADKIREAEKETQDYTKWVALVGMAVAAAGAIVSTAGTASVVVVGIGIALSASGFVVSETQCIGKEWSNWVGLGLSVAGAVTSGVGAATAASAATKTATEVARVLAGSGQALEGVAQMRQGAEQIRSAATQKVVEDANTDAQAARFSAQRLERLIEDILDEVREAKDSFRRIATTINETMEIQNRTQLIAIAGMRG